MTQHNPTFGPESPEQRDARRKLGALILGDVLGDVAEGDFCPIDGATFQPWPGRHGRWCASCGRPEPEIEVLVRRPDRDPEFVRLSELLEAS